MSASTGYGLCDSCSETARPSLAAAKEGHMECLKFACDSLGLAYDRDGYGATPLHFAARHGHLSCLQWLVEYSTISPTVVTRGGTTAAHDAAATGNIECLKYLLKNTKCLLEHRTVDGSTMLHMACRFGKLAMIKWLVSECSVSPNEMGVNSVTPVHICSAKGHLKCLRWLTSYMNYLPNMETIHGATPTYFAAQEGCLQSLEWLVDHAQGDTMHSAKDGMLPIHAAAQAGHLDCLKWLITKSLNTVNELSADGGTPMHFAAAGGHVDTLSWLIINGGNVNAVDNCRSTPLHDAAQQDQPRTLKLLIESGATLELMDDECYTPLELAVERSATNCIEIIHSFLNGTLLDNSFDSHKVNNIQIISQEVTEQVIAQEEPQRDFELLLSPSFEETDHPKSLRGSKFTKILSWKNRLVRTPSDSRASKKKKLFRKNSFSNSNDHISKQKDIKETDVDTELFDQDITYSPLFKDALINPKSPVVIRVVRQTNETRLENPRFSIGEDEKQINEELQIETNSKTSNDKIILDSQIEGNFRTMVYAETEKAETSIAASENNSTKGTLMESHEAKKFYLNSWLQYQSKLNELQTRAQIYNITETNEEIESSPKTEILNSDLLKTSETSKVMRAIEIFSQDSPVASSFNSKKSPPPILPKPKNVIKLNVMNHALIKSAKDNNTITPQSTLLVSVKENLNKVSTKEINRYNEYTDEESLLDSPQKTLVTTNQINTSIILDQKKVNMSLLEKIKKIKLATAESASLAILGPPLLGQRRINQAFIGLSTQPGLMCWKLGASLNQVLKGSAMDGHMYTTDIYLYLYTSLNGPVYHQVHLWIGLQCDMDRFPKAAAYCHDLTDSLSGLSHVYKETQGLESEKFLSYFKKSTIFYHQIISHKLFSKTCLYEVSGIHFYRCTQVSTSIDRFSNQKSFILLSQKTIYLWTGTQAPECLKINALQIALNLREKLEMTSFLLVSYTHNFERFQSAIRTIERDQLNDFTPIIQNIKAVNFKIRYYQANLKYQTNPRDYIESKYSQHLFSTDKIVYIITQYKLIIWVGQKCRTPGFEYLKFGQSFLTSFFYPEHLPIVIIYEYGEGVFFENLFPNRLKPNFKLLNINTLKELNLKPNVEASMRDGGLGKTVIYEIHKTGIDFQHTNAFGHFDSTFCYIIVYSYRRDVKFLSILYVWVGSESSIDILRNAEYQLRELNKSIKSTTSEIYIPQGMETDHFLSLFKTKFICYQKSFCRATHNGDAYLFRILSYNILSLKTMQVDAIATSLLSNSAYVLIADTISIVWIGQEASQNDRRGAMFNAKSLKPQEPMVLLEGEENERFWRLLGGRNAYSPSNSIQWPQQNGEPTLFHFSKVVKSLFTPLANFKQEDLHSDSIFLLDLGYLVIIWRGNRTEEMDYRTTASEYLAQVSTERILENTILNIIYQGSELSTFVSYFKDWNDNYWNKPILTYEDHIKKTVILKQPPPTKNKVEQMTPNLIDHTYETYTIDDNSKIDKYFQTQLTLDSNQNTQNESAHSNTILPSMQTTASRLANDILEEISDLDKVLSSFDTEISNSMKELHQTEYSDPKTQSLVKSEQQNDDFNFDAIIRDLDLALLDATSKLQSNNKTHNLNDQETLMETNFDISSGEHLALPIVQNLDHEKMKKMTINQSEVELQKSPKLNKAPYKQTPYQKKTFQHPETNQLSEKVIIPIESPKLKIEKPIAKESKKQNKTKLMSKLSPIFDKKPVQESEHNSVYVYIEKSKQFISISCKKNTNAQNLIYNIVSKFRVKLTPALCIFERIVHNNLERKLEAHELMLNIVNSWPQPQTGNVKAKYLLILKEFTDKFDLLGYIISIRDIQSIIGGEKALPELQGEIFLNRTSKNAFSGNTWISARLQYQDDGIYKISSEKYKECIVKFLGTKVYQIYNKEAAESRFPSQHCFILRPVNSWDPSDFYIFSVPDDEQLAHWVGYVRVGIFGLDVLYNNWQAVNTRFV